ncbi:MAG: hypothetical protein COV91_03130 [Candidatus Taylorbacteria bacterium CG11_big_fil_rev_8_21_14_0_20_46_11]|uniref:SpoVT-AbrB domain-containing protein n=1 Tax=Candidatus Taylorbacteria bacterium CG11_big_fil_rev_8_21_14_0_20_46_11 TaxID=1975025 RepID=A0A2H0KDG5_9BACT|nr:MAG: hypothetical protein COV91_03130 [Candidatus Taylorbacteria bacterium CG11_big_fil_rev_8_21_14_0_20_46_11]
MKYRGYIIDFEKVVLIDWMYIQVYTYFMSTKVTKWGNSLGLRIPHELATKYRLRDGVKVAFTGTPKGVLVTAVVETAGKRLPPLREAMANFIPEMTERVDWGRDVGKEIIQ